MDGKKKMKAMHGYDPKIKDMRAFYLIKKEGDKRDININDLHKEFEKLKRKEI